MWSDDRLEVAQILMCGRWRCNGCLLRRVCAAPFLLESHDHCPLLVNRQGARCHWGTALLRGPGRARFAVRLVVDAHTVIIPHRVHICVLSQCPASRPPRHTLPIRRIEARLFDDASNIGCMHHDRVPGRVCASIDADVIHIAPRCM